MLVCPWRLLRVLLPPPPLNLPRDPPCALPDPHPSTRSLFLPVGGGERGVLAAGGTPPFLPTCFRPFKALPAAAAKRLPGAPRASPSWHVPGTTPPMAAPHPPAGVGMDPGRFAGPEGTDTCEPGLRVPSPSGSRGGSGVSGALLLVGMRLERGQAVPEAADSFCS